MREGGTTYVSLDTSATQMELDAFKAYMNAHPLMIIYELANPTIETTDPFQRIQNAGTTEEFLDTRDVAISVGHETFYPYNLRKRIENIPDAPTANGTYELRVTVTNGVPVYSWVSV